MNTIYNIVLDREIYLFSILHKIKTNRLREDINLLYPDFIKTCIFETIRFDIEDYIDPGYTCYEIKSLTDCGSITNYEILPPITEYSEYNNYKDYNRVKLINTIRRKYSLTIYGRKQIKIILNRLKKFSEYR